MRLSISVVLLFVFSIHQTFGQSFQGSLRGRVLDSSGSAVAAARVTITDEGTGEARNTVTNDLGEYAFTAVNPSTYTLSAEEQGFKKLERRGIEIATQANVALDLTLEIGQISESVNVTAETPALQTADASTGQEIDNQKITDLPILGRNPFFTGKLAQAVVFVANPKFARMQDQNGNSQVSIGGGPLRTNNYLVDGISITDSNNRAVIVPSPEAVEEMKVQASTYDAEVGRTGGGSFNTLLRGGTNDLHGSAVGHIRQTDWNANNFFANKAGQPIAAQPFRDWAFSLGGPIVLPKIYDGHNKTFFFASDESYREVDGSTTTLSVPTALERIGNFSQSFTKAGTLQTIYDPLSTNLTTGARTPFTNNIIPASELSQAGMQLGSYYPLPNGPTPYYGAPNYTFTGSYPNRGDQRIFKVDHQFTEWLRASASYIHQKTFEVDAPGDIFPNAVFASPSQTFCCDRKIDATQANATATPNSTTVITVRWGFNRFYSKSTQESAGFNLASLGFPASLVAATPNPAFPAITLGAAVNGCSSPASNTDFADFGGGCTAQDVFYSRNLNAGVAKFLGRHSLKAGFETRTIHDIGTPASGPTSLGFTDVFTRATPQVATSGTGSDLATLLLGYPTSGQQSIVSRFDDFVTYYGGYVQDDFRVTPKLTMNFGLRFEYESGIRESNNKLIVGFNATAPSPLQVPGLSLLGGVQYAGVNGAPTQTGNALGVKPSPRFGLAYAADNKTVIRGGYGIYWVPTFFNFQNAIGYSQTTSIVASANGNFTPAATITNPYPNGLLQPTGNSLSALSGIGQAITIFNPQTQSAGYVQEYSLEVQRQIPAGIVLTVGTLGSHALHLLQNGQNIDQLNPSYFSLGSALTQSVANPLYGNGGVGTVGTPTVSRLQLLLPFPQYTSVTLANSGTASSIYYSFYFRAQKRYSNGISLLASFTHSRSEDNVTGSNTAGASQVVALVGPQNAYNLNGEWSLSTQDVPNRFTTAFTYELPFGKGKRFLSNGRLLSLVAGGWSVNAVNIIQTGFPLSVVRYPSGAEGMAAYRRLNASGRSTAAHHAPDIPAQHWLFGELARFADRGVEQRSLAVVRNASGLDGGVEIFFELVVTRHFVQLTVFFMEPEPPAILLRIVILDGQRDDRADTGEVYVITAMGARSRKPTTLETAMPVSSAVASSDDSTGVAPFVTE